MTITNLTDIFDSRDVIQLVDKFRERRTNGEQLTADEAEYEASLRSLIIQAQDYAEDWEYGVPLIRDSYFLTYTMDLAYDCGMISDDLTWPLTCIDWNQAARELQMDYTPIEWGGVTYWVR